MNEQSGQKMSFTDFQRLSQMPQSEARVPTYYLGKNGAPAWDAIENWLDGKYTAGCAFKYLVRAGKKTADPRDDLRKAIACIERLIELHEGTLK